MTTIIERIARAIGEAMIQDGKPGALELDYPWLEGGDSNNAYNLEDMARAALVALREPTDSVLAAHHVVPDDTNFHERAADNWRSMIDAAMLDKPPEHPQ